jgi:hypothetical protein
LILQNGIQGLHDELKAEKVALLVRKTLQKVPKDGTHWTIRSIAWETRLSHPTVHRIWQAARDISSSPLTHSLLKKSVILSAFA